MPDFLELHLDSISVTNAGFIVFLKTEGQTRVLPIFIGANEAQAIALALGEDRPPRPLTHDLLKGMLDALDAAITRVEITDLKDGTFYARVYVSHGEIEVHEFDARPSDAIALAVRYDAPIFAAHSVFEEAAIHVVLKNSGDGNNEIPTPEPELEDADVEPNPDGNPGGPDQTRDEPAPTPPPPSLTPLEKLKADLNAAVADERYEEAARLRDVLKKMGAN